jgi:predicted transcriptional regulator of viral defense system
MLPDFLRTHPVFTAKELTEYLARQKARSKWTEKALLAYHLKKKHIARVRRGLYTTVPPGSKTGTPLIDSYLLASRMAQDAVLAYHTALEFHGRAYSTFQNFYYLTNSSARVVVYRGNRFQPVKFPRRLREHGKTLFGVLDRERSGLSLRVTSLERTLVDTLDRPDLCGGWEEVWRSLESVEFFDLDQIVEYSLLLANATTIAKVGFFLEQHKQALMVEESHLRRLREHRPRSPHYAARGDKRPVQLSSQWNLILPTDVVERSWEEVR